ncbi:MAG TPA: hypothetical protein VM284_01030 [Candidatus Limnocylindria bacterium]|nr:hypothetical protein [Candidatus Limnocylindria bacterium]
MSNVVVRWIEVVVGAEVGVTAGLDDAAGFADAPALADAAGADVPRGAGLDVAPGVPVVAVSDRARSKVAPISGWPTYVTMGVGVAAGSSTGGTGIVTVQSPVKTNCQVDCDAAAIAPDSGTPLTGDPLAPGEVEGAVVWPGADELPGADVLPGRPLALGDVDGLEPAPAPAQPAAMTMTARIDCQASELDTRMKLLHWRGAYRREGEPRP